MKIKNLICSAAFIGALLCTGIAWSQIDYSEDFEGTVDWNDPDGWFYADIPFEPCDNFTYITYLYSDYSSYDVATVSPSIGISNGGQATLSYDYKIVLYNTPGVALQNDPSWGSIKVEYATSETGSWTVLDIITPENHIVSTSCGTRTAEFTPAAGSTIYLKLTSVVNGETPGIDAIVYFDNIAVVQAAPCTTPAPVDLAATQAVCSNANIGDLSIGDYNTILWYSGAVGGGPLASSASITNGTTYYAANLEECESIERTAVTVTINIVEAPEVSSGQTYCSGASVSDLQVEDEAAQVLWYAGETGGSPLAATASLTDGTTYYVSQLVEGCESARTPVSVAITTVAAPGVTSPQVFESSEPVTVMLYDIEVDATGTVTWYATEQDALAGNAALAETTALTEGGMYYVTQTISGCQSAPVSVVIDIVLGTADFEKFGLSFYPNPVTDILTLSGDTAIDSVTVYSLLGQELMQKQLHQNDQAIDMAQLPSGAYLLAVKSREHTATIRIVKQ